MVSSWWTRGSAWESQKVRVALTWFCWWVGCLDKKICTSNLKSWSNKNKHFEFILLNCDLPNFRKNKANPIAKFDETDTLQPPCLGLLSSPIQIFQQDPMILAVPVYVRSDWSCQLTHTVKLLLCIAQCSRCLCLLQGLLLKFMVMGNLGRMNTFAADWVCLSICRHSLASLSLKK